MSVNRPGTRKAAYRIGIDVGGAFTDFGGGTSDIMRLIVARQIGL